MAEERVCPKCQEIVESGAAFCGNCGFQLIKDSRLKTVYSKGTSDSNSNLMTVRSGSELPTYAIPHAHHKQHWAAMALAFGILGIGASVIIPIMGIGLGLAGLILTTSSYRVTHSRLKIGSFIVSAVAILVGISFWVNAIHNSQALANNQAGTNNGVATINVNTPCYSITFNGVLNVDNSKGSCTMNAYNGPTFSESSNVYKVVATKSALVASNFESSSKQGIANDISKNLPGFSITKEGLSSFAGSPAYFDQAYDKSTNVAVIEEAVLHQSSSNDNLFVIVHAVSGTSININNIESTWQWND